MVTWVLKLLAFSSVSLLIPLECINAFSSSNSVDTMGRHYFWTTFFYYFGPLLSKEISFQFFIQFMLSRMNYEKRFIKIRILFQKCFNPNVMKRSMMGLCFVYRCECTFLICIGTPLRITSYSMTYSLTWYYYIIQQKIWEKGFLEIASNWFILLTSWTA